MRDEKPFDVEDRVGLAPREDKSCRREDIAHRDPGQLVNFAISVDDIWLYICELVAGQH